MLATGLTLVFLKLSIDPGVIPDTNITLSLPSCLCSNQSTRGELLGLPMACKFRSMRDLSCRDRTESMMSLVMDLRAPDYERPYEIAWLARACLTPNQPTTLMTVVPTSVPPATTTSVLGYIVGDKCVYRQPALSLTLSNIAHVGFGSMVEMSMPTLPSTALTPSISAHTHVSVAAQCKVLASA
jgi:hypothetical protein